MENNQWVSLLAKEFNVSRTVAKTMLHSLFVIKKQDEFRKEFKTIGKTS